MKLTPRRARWICSIGAAVIRLIGSTWRIRVSGTPLDLDCNELLVAFLHGDMLVPAVLYRRVPAAVMISRHGDGELIAQVIERLGAHVPVRGSSSRGGARAFLEMVKDKGQMNWAITPDGPRGPRGSVGEGVVALAAESGRPIVVAGFAVARGKHLRSWDRFVIPCPFTRIAVHWSAPIPIPAQLDRDQRRQTTAQIEASFRDAHEAAVRALESW